MHVCMKKKMYEGEEDINKDIKVIHYLQQVLSDHHNHQKNK